MRSEMLRSLRLADSPQLMPLKAILFDFDGVIADTDNHHIAAWQRTLAVMGWQVADEVAARSAEIDDREFLAELFAQRGITSDKIDDWVRRKQALTVQLLKDSPRLYPGVAELVRKLQGTRSPGGRLRHLAREHPGRPRGRRPGRLVRDDRRQRGRDVGETRPRALISLR